MHMCQHMVDTVAFLTTEISSRPDTRRAWLESPGPTTVTLVLSFQAGSERLRLGIGLSPFWLGHTIVIIGLMML